MPRKPRDKNLESRTGRAGLKRSKKPYYKSIGAGLRLGYRKNKGPGKWVMDRYLGKRQYESKIIAVADDAVEADGVKVLTFWQAVDEARKQAKLLPTERSGPYRVRDAVADYLENVLKGKPSLNDARLRLEAYAIPTLGDRIVGELQAKALRKWHRDLAEMPARIRTGKGQKQRTRPIDKDDPEVVRQRKVSANNILGLLKAALNHAFVEGNVLSDAEWRRVKPFKDVKRSRASYLKRAECTRLLNACDADFRKLVRGALETGCRYGELCRMRCGDYNPDSGTVYVNLSKDGKSKHVVLTEEGQDFFAGLVAGQMADAWMFGRQWSASQQDRPIRAACQRAGIDPPINFHALRHTWASLSIRGGAPLAVVARSLGHVDTRMVEKHYGHLAESYVADAIRAGAPRFGKVAAKARAIR